MDPVILVIDDNPKVKESLELAFPEYTFHGALSGEEGLKFLQKPHEAELVILDYKMGGLNGLETLQEIKRANPSIGVFLLTSFGTREVAIGALRASADDFIDKPFVVEDMKRKIESFFESKQRYEKRVEWDRGSVQRIVRLLEKNFQKCLTLDQAALAASLSPKYLSRKFKQETNRNFTEFRTDLRLTRAKKLLQESSFNVGQIADKVGYGNAESFMKVFKKKVGCTPTEYRLQMLNPAKKSSKHRQSSGPSV